MGDIPQRRPVAAIPTLRYTRAPHAEAHALLENSGRRSETEHLANAQQEDMKNRMHDMCPIAAGLHKYTVSAVKYFDKKFSQNRNEDVGRNV